MNREEILAANPIDQYLIALGHKLKRNGAGWTCRCPSPHHSDNNPSFSIFDNNRACKCHSCGIQGSIIDLHMALTGCDVATAFAFFNPNKDGKTTIVAKYDYVDEGGRPLYQVVRELTPEGKKTFKHRRKGPEGEWIWNMEGTPRVPYHLDELVRPGPLFRCVAEGEKDVDLLRSLGLCTTCNSGGAEKWNPEFSSKYLTGQDVVIFYDRDEPGIKHIKLVAKSLLGHAKSVRVAELPEGFKDVGEVKERRPAEFENIIDKAVREAKNFTDWHGNGSDKNNANSRAGAGSGKPCAWPKPTPLEEYLSPVLPLSADMMPEAMADFVVDAARRLGCPIDYIATASIVAIGSVIASRVRMRPLHYNNWEIAPNLWGGITGDPGTKKSPAMGKAFTPIDRLKIDEATAFEKAQEAHRKAMASHSAEIKLYRDAIARLRKKQITGSVDERDTEKLNQLKSELEQLEAREPQAPKRRRFRLNDQTIEAVQEILKNDHTCLLVDRDELTGMLSQWEMDGHQNDRPFYLESWNGLHPYDGARVGRGDFFIPNLCLSLFGGIQPAKLAQYLRNPKVCLTIDGALQRFQLLVYPDQVPHPGLVDTYENTSAKNRFFSVLQKLASADFHTLGGQSDQFNPIPWFHFSIESKKEFEKWFEKNELLVSNKDENPLLRQHFAKFDKLICGLALIFHLIELADKGGSERYIPLPIFEQAFRWVEYLTSHARRIYDLSESPSLSAAWILAAKLKDPEVKNPLEPGFTARDIRRHHWIGLTSEDDINSALARLEDVNWLRQINAGTAPQQGGRPTVAYDIHPAILAARNGAQNNSCL